MCCPNDDEGDCVGSDDRIIEQLVSRNPVRIGEGITKVHRRYGREMADRLRNRFGWLTSDEIAQIWNRTLEQLATKSLAGDFQAEGSLNGLIWMIVFRRGIDLRRWKCRRSRQQQLDENAHGDLLSAENEDLPLEDLLRVIREAIRELPDRQRQVWDAFAELGFHSKKETLLAEASKQAGKPLTWKAVCRALQEGRKKVIESLKRRGYHW